MSDQSQSDSFDANLDVFRQEADELLGKIEAIVLVIEERPADHDALNQLFRAVHTLKGSSARFGLTDVAEFSHTLESVLDKVRSGQLLVNRTVIDLTLAVGHHLPDDLRLFKRRVRGREFHPQPGTQARQARKRPRSAGRVPGQVAIFVPPHSCPTTTTDDQHQPHDSGHKQGESL